MIDEEKLLSWIKRNEFEVKDEYQYFMAITVKDLKEKIMKLTKSCKDTTN